MEIEQEKKISRYLLFSWPADYGKEGGWYDFVHHGDDIEELKKLAYLPPAIDWVGVHIVDLQTHKVVWTPYEK